MLNRGATRSPRHLAREGLFEKGDAEGMARLHALEAALRPTQS
jgi:hypothetical protein